MYLPFKGTSFPQGRSRRFHHPSKLSFTMAATVLGKRQRGAIEPEGNSSRSFSFSILTDFFSIALPLRSGSKRRARVPQIHEEENGHPFIPSTVRLRSKTGDANGPQQGTDTNVKSSTIGNGRSKRNVRNDNTLSPSKIDAHFRASKSVTGKIFT
jgi:cell division control protein 6